MKRPARAALVAVLLSLALWAPAGAADNAVAARTFEQRAEAEKHTRSRYRRLEVASTVLIVVAGGGAILWAIRRR